MKYYLPVAPLIFSFICIAQKATPDYAGVKYGPESRQFLDIYLAPSETPTPVYFDAHGNGGDTSMPQEIIDDLKAEGISIVAWESYTAVKTPDSVETAWEDATLMFEWVKENAATYHFDTSNFIIGGSSRGSILSWKYAHSGDPNIKGLYMYNALPSNVWVDPNWWYPPNEVKATSPPIFFVYKREPGSSENAADPDIHDPNNGITIMEKYDELDIGDRDTLVHSIGETDNTDKYQFLVDFALSVISPEVEVVLSDQFDEPTIEKLHAYPNPFSDSITIQGLRGNEYVILTSSSGNRVQEGYELQQFQTTQLKQGVYLLSIQREGVNKTIKLIKE